MYHEGELEVQARAGVRTLADQVGRSIRDFIPPSVMMFLRMQRFAVIGSVGEDSSVWASAAIGQPGFLSTPDPHTLTVAPAFVDDLLRRNLQHNDAVGVLVLDPATRRRVRINGQAQISGDEILIHVREAFANCPQYIQQRMPEAAKTDVGDRQRGETSELSSSQQDWIAQADTFFLATTHSEAGADASHRGGMPGFVHVETPNRLSWPDYYGNNMFQSLGNLTRNPKAGLLFVDFEKGRTLQLSGEGKVVWDANRAAQFPGAERVVEFTILHVVETKAAFPERWKFLEYSPVNPK